MAKIKNMGHATAKFNEGLIVEGKAASDTHTFIASGSSAFVNDDQPQLRLDCGKNPEFGQIFADFQATSAGDLAITGSSPNANCTFLSNGHTTMIVQSNAGGDADTSLAFSVDSGASLAFSLGVDDSDGDKFKIGTSLIDTNTRLTIDSAGLVGIGTASPVEKLEVNGNIKAADVYADRIRRATDSGTTTKILLNDEEIKLYAGHSSNQVCTVDANGLTVHSGLTLNVRDVNSTSSILSTDYLLRCIQTANITITLPAKSGNAGRVLIFKDAMGNAGSPNNDTITIDGDNLDAIDGNATYVINRNGESITLICDGINGWMIASRIRP